MAKKNFAKVKLYSRFHEAVPGQVKPLGFLKEFLTRQYKGLCGHHSEMKFPYDSCLWAGNIQDPHLVEGVYNGGNMPVAADGAWWPYEQSGYLLDGMVRLSFLVDAPDLRKEYEKSLNYVISHPDDKDVLARKYAYGQAEWPTAVFFKSVIAYYEGTKDKKVYDAFYKHFKNYEKGLMSWFGMRHLPNIEGALKMYEWSGDKELLKQAVEDYKGNNEAGTKGKDLFAEMNFSKMLSDEWISLHGVTFSEGVKIPAMLYAYTGDKKWLDGAKRGLDKVYAQHEQPVGQISANEFTSGRDPLQGYETCVTSDMMWSLGYFVMADGTIRYADRMEKLAYNAMPGAITKDFTGLQYLSCVNQVIASPFSNNVQMNYGESAWKQYRPDQFPQCCPGNLQRTLPNYVLRTWMLNVEDGAPVAVLYGPTEFTFEYNGVKGTITENTEYPFSDDIRFRFKLDKKVKMPFRFRLPEWTKKASVKINGKAVKMTLKAGTFAEIEREWQNGDELLLTLPAEVTVKHDRQWCWLERGSIVFSYAVPCDEVRDNKSRFSPRSYIPTGDWNFALTLTDAQAKKLVPEYRKAKFPFEKPSMVLRVPVERIKGYNELECNRFTPQVPIFTHLTGEKVELELVPFGTTTARITCFPDGVKRKELPVVAAYGDGPYPYNYMLPIEIQKFPAEEQNSDAYRRKPIVQRDGSQFFDFERHFKCQEGHLAYMMFRVWSDKDADATFCIGCSTTAQIFIDGEQVMYMDGIRSGEMVEPQWFKHPVKKGYNYVLAKVACGPRNPSYRNSWGAKLTVFCEE